MRIKSSIMIGVLVSVMTLCAAFADSVVTSKSYVDAQDALKQDKITAGTRGSVVTYAGEVGGYAQFGEMRVNDSSFELGSSVNELATTGLLVPPYQLLEDISVINSNEVLVRAVHAGGSYVEGLAIFSSDGTYNAGTDADKLATMGAVMASMAASGSQPALSGTNGAIVTYGNAPGVTGERKILSEWYQPFVPGVTAGNGDHLVDAQSVMGVVYTIGNRPISVMECADGENVSDEDCMLWHISQRHVLSWPSNAGYQRSPFINSSEFPSYEPYNP